MWKTIYYPNHWVTITKNTTQGVLCKLIPQLLKFWKIKFESVGPYFLKWINSLCQLVEKCQLSIIGTVGIFLREIPNWTKLCLVHIPIQVILGFASLFRNTQLKQMASCSYFNSSHFRVCIFFGKYPNWNKYVLFIISICQFMVCMFLGDLPNWRSHLTLSCFCWLFPCIVVV